MICLTFIQNLMEHLGISGSFGFVCVCFLKRFHRIVTWHSEAWLIIFCLPKTSHPFSVEYLLFHSRFVFLSLVSEMMPLDIHIICRYAHTNILNLIIHVKDMDGLNLEVITFLSLLIKAVWKRQNHDDHYLRHHLSFIYNTGSWFLMKFFAFDFHRHVFFYLLTIWPALWYLFSWILFHLFIIFPRFSF